MTSANASIRQTLEIVIDELVTDEEFRDAFLRSPRKTLRVAATGACPCVRAKSTR